MSSELITKGTGTGATLYATIRGSGSSIWSTSGGTGALETYTAANYADYAITLTEQGSTNVYLGNAPAALPLGLFNVFAQRQAGGSPAVGDAIISFGELNWNGVQAVPLTNLATSGQVAGISPIRIARGVAISGFMFYMVSSADHVSPITSGAVLMSGQISKDGGSFGALQSGEFQEVGLGIYKTNLTSGDLLCTTAALIFTNPSADPRVFTLVTQKVSGTA